MGLAHLLYLMEIPFDSEEALKFKDELYQFLTITSMKESVEIAKEVGSSYPAFDDETYFNANERFFRDGKNLDLFNDIKKFGIRNSCNSSVAPNGSIGFMADTSSGIEPVFALSYERKIEKLDKIQEYVYISDPIFNDYLDKNFDSATKEKILKKVSDNKGSCQKVKEIPENMRKVFVVASDISPMDHLNSLAVIAKNISLSVSKTINLSENATREQISEVYLKAHELNVIGVTVYRDGCREGVLVHKNENNKDLIVKTNAPKRPKSLPCHVYKINTLNRITNEGEKWIVFVGLLENEPFEIIAGKIDLVDIPSNITEGFIVKYKKEGKSTYKFESNGEVIISDLAAAFVNEFQEYATKLMSWGLRHGGGINFLRDLLAKSNGTIVDFNKTIIKAINKYVKETKKEKCPQCDADMIYTDGCIKCSNPECGFSKCG